MTKLRDVTAVLARVMMGVVGTIADTLHRD